MRKLVALFLMLTMTLGLCGCSFLLEAGNPPTLPKLSFDESTLKGQVEYVNGRTCKVTVLEGDSHFRAATEKREADTVYVTYSSLEGSKSVQVGDTVSVTYAYTTDVSERDGEPHIIVRAMKVSK